MQGEKTLYVFDLITVAQMFIYSALFIRGRMFLCADKQSSVCFADVRRIRPKIIIPTTPHATTKIQLSGLPYHLSVTLQHSLLINLSVSFVDVSSTRM